MYQEYSLTEKSNTESSSGGSGIDKDDSTDSQKERMQKARCRSEKKRRDKLNLFIRDLQIMLSPSQGKRLDKSSVLKMTVDYLKMHNDLTVNVDGERKVNKSFFLPCEELGQLMLEVLNGFIIVINGDAKFVYVADVAEKILGVKSNTLIDKTIYALVHKDDQQKITDELIAGATGNNESARISAATLSRMNDSQLSMDTVKLSFRILIQRENSNPEYRGLTCTGKWSHYRDKGGTPFGDNLLVLLACVDKTDLRAIAPDNTTTNSFSSKNSLDGSFLFADTSCPKLTGYLPYELLGKSIYWFVHNDDLIDLCKIHEKVTKATANEKMLVYFRFRSKGEEWILFGVEISLMLKPDSKEPDHLCFKFMLASKEENHEFRSFMNAKTAPIKNYLSKVFRNNSSINKIQEIREKDESSEVKSQKKIVEKDIESSTARTSSPQPRTNLPTLTTSTGTSSSSSQVTVPEEEDERDHFLKAQKNLHAQLTNKHKVLSETHKRQNEQIKNIESLMQGYQYFMQAPSFKTHYEQQVEMLKYFKYMLKKQQRQQEYVEKILKGKVKELEIRQRAIKLRQMASRQQKALTNMLEANKDQRQLHTNETSSVPNTSITSSSNSIIGEISRTLINTPSFSTSHLPKFMTNSLLNSTSGYSVHSSLSNSANVTTVPPVNMLALSASPSTAVPVNTVTPKSSKGIVGVNVLQNQLQQLQQIQKQNAQMHPQEQSSTPGAAKSQQNDMFLLNNLHQLLQNQLPEPEKSSQSSFTPSTSLPQVSIYDGKTQKNSTIENQTGGAKKQSVPEMELQSKISKQILVHLQVLQKHVLNQLQSVLQDKAQNEKTADFSQVLPVLQQLQQLQQSIIDQQQQNQHQNVSNTTQPSSVGMSTPVTLDAPRNTSNSAGTSEGFVNSMMNSSPDNLFLLGEGTNNMVNCLTEPKNDSSSNLSSFSNMFTNSNDMQTNGSAFGDLSATKIELNNIKNAFTFDGNDSNQQKQTSDCFPNLPSPELRSLMFNDDTNLLNDTGNEKNDEDEDLKKSKGDETETLSSFEAQMGNQHLLAQLQRQQRMQLFMQQQEQLERIQSDLETSPNPMPNNGSGTNLQENLLSPNLPTPTQEQETNNREENSNRNSVDNPFDQNNHANTFSGQNVNELMNSWIPSENEEVLNMLLSDGELFW